MAINFDIKDPKNQRILASFLVPVVIFYAFFHFMIKPKVTELNVKKVEVVKLKKRVNDIKKTLEQPELLNEEKANLEEKFVELERLLPSEENVAVLLDQFSMVENDSKVYMVGFEATETVDDGSKPYRANKYRVTIESGFHQFAQFMSNIMTLPRILSFSGLNISLNTELDEATEIPEGLEDQPRTLRIECTLTTYVFKDLNDEGS